MAILDGLPEIKVSIFSGTDELKEYDDDITAGAPVAPSTVMKYIESVDDAPFSFRIHHDGGFINECLYLFLICKVDGEEVGAKSFAYKKNRGVPETIKSGAMRINQADGTALIKPYKFGKLNIIPAEDLCDVERTAAELSDLIGKGEFIVEIHRVGERNKVKVHQHNLRKPPAEKSTKGNRKHAEDEARENQMEEKLTELTEKATIKSGITHLAGFGEGHVVGSPTPVDRGQVHQSQDSTEEPAEPAEEPAEPVEETEAYHLDSVSTPMATYIFKYRSKASLQAMLIIKSTPEPQAQSEIQLPSPPATQIPSPSATNTPRSPSDSQSATVLDDTSSQNVELTSENMELTSENMVLIVLHNFDIKDVSMSQLHKLAKLKLKTLPVEKIRKIIERDPDPEEEAITLDDLNISETRLLALYQLDVSQLSWSEIRRLVALRLEKMTTEEVTGVIGTQKRIKREIKAEAGEEEDIYGSGSAKRAKTSSQAAVPEFIDLSED